jgi:hyperosmotically inducible periplasmic protein
MASDLPCVLATPGQNLIGKEENTTMIRPAGLLIAALLLAEPLLSSCAPAVSQSDPPPGFGQAFSDAAITISVKLSIALERGVKASEINVRTDRGTVTLHGEVGSQAERRLAVKVAEGVSGVKAVVNQIRVHG